MSRSNSPWKISWSVPGRRYGKGELITGIYSEALVSCHHKSLQGRCGQQVNESVAAYPGHKTVLRQVVSMALATQIHSVLESSAGVG